MVDIIDQPMSFGLSGTFPSPSSAVKSLSRLSLLHCFLLNSFPKSINGFTKLFRGLDKISGRPSTLSNRSPFEAERYCVWSPRSNDVRKSANCIRSRVPFPNAFAPSSSSSSLSSSFSSSSSSTTRSTITVSFSSLHFSLKKSFDHCNRHSNSVSLNPPINFTGVRVFMISSRNEFGCSSQSFNSNSFTKSRSGSGRQPA